MQRGDRPLAGRASSPERPHAAARADLRFIRETMGRAATFTAVPGHGGVVMGAIGLAAAGVGAGTATLAGWLAAWLGAAALAGSAGAVTTWRKARAAGLRVLVGAGRKFAMGLAPSLAAGAALTVAVVMVDVAAGSLSMAPSESVSLRLLPGIWLLLYGAGVMAAGSFSVRPVPLLGAGCMITGVAALAAPPEWAHVLLGLGFGLLQVGFGIYIARRFGG